jgi:hypothetical protein
VLAYLKGSVPVPGMSKPFAFDLGIPAEHLEHPHEFGFWLDFLAGLFNVQLDADDTIIRFLYKEGMLIKGAYINAQDRTMLKAGSEGILDFLSKRSSDIDAMICELPGYIGSRAAGE